MLAKAFKRFSLPSQILPSKLLNIISINILRFSLSREDPIFIASVEIAFAACKTMNKNLLFQLTESDEPVVN